MSRSPRVSVILPTRNRASMLKEAIESVRAQTFSNWELIVVDDGSSDETPAVVREYYRADQRIRCVRQRNGGLTAVRHAGLKQAAGEYVAFLDDDDRFLPGKLAHQTAVMDAHPLLGFVYGLSLIRYDDGRPDKIHPPKPGRTFQELFMRNLPQVVGVLVRRSSLGEVGGFDGRFSPCEDYDLWLRLAERFPFDYTEETVGIYRRHDTSMSHDFDRLLKAQLRLLRSLKGWRRLQVKPSVRRARLAGCSYALARCQLEEGRYWQAAGSFWRSILWMPQVGLRTRRSAIGSFQKRVYHALRPYLAIAYCIWRGLLLHAER